MARLRAADLEAVQPLLDSLRAFDALTEPSPGRFTRGRAAFLHFHTPASGLVTDVKVDDGWLRYEVRDVAGRRTLVRDVRRILAGERSGLAGRPT